MHGEQLPASASDGSARERLTREGAVVIRDLLDPDWCARLHEAIERCRASPGPHYGVLSPPGCARVDSDLFRWGDDPSIAELTHRSPLVGAAAELLGGVSEVVLIEDQWFASEPRATTPSPWHQDEPYYRLDRPFLTIWITLDDIGMDASLRVVEGSHLGPLFAPVEFSATESTIEQGTGATSEVLASVPPIDQHPDQFAVRSWELRAGDAIALDSRTLHATGSGVLDHPFRRVSTRWTTTDTRYRERTTATASFWDELPHGLSPGELIAGAMFPTIAV